MSNAVGIKVNNDTLLSEKTSTFPLLFKAGYSYIEFQAPIFNLKLFSKLTGISRNKLRPHSIFLSLTKEKGLCKLTCERLKSDVLETKSSYLGEHLGSINYKNVYPTHFYLYPPILTKETISTIKKNARMLIRKVNVPLALENPVFYCYQKEDRMSYLTFLRKLDNELPQKTGWLIDVSHLLVTCKNLNCSIIDVIEFFINSKRKIFEIHLSSLSYSENGIFNDNHIIKHSDEFFLLNLQIAMMLSDSDTSITIETKFLDVAELKKIISLLKKSKKNDIEELKQNSVFKKLQKKRKPALKYLRNHELNGRKKIIESSLRTIMLNKLSEKKIFEYFKFNDYEELSLAYLKFNIDFKKRKQIDYTDTRLALIYFFAKNLRKSTISQKVKIDDILAFFQHLASEHALLLHLKLLKQTKININFFLNGKFYSSVQIKASNMHVKVTKNMHILSNVFKTQLSYDIKLTKGAAYEKN